MEELRKIRHFTQIDPAKENSDILLQIIGESPTEGIIYAGSGGYDGRVLLDILKRSQKYIPQKKFPAPFTPAIFPPEVSDQVFLSTPPLANGVLIYSVINSSNPEFIIGSHKDWYRKYFESKKLPPLYSLEMGYLIVSTKGTIKKIVPLDEDLSIDNIVSYACAAAPRYPIIYLETTGLEGWNITPSEYLREIRRRLTEIGYQDKFIISGGGIRSEEEAKLRLDSGADAINVGDPIYESKEGLEDWLSTILGAIPETKVEQSKELIEELFP